MDDIEMKKSVLRGARPGLEKVVEWMRFEPVVSCWCGGKLENWLREFEPYRCCAKCGCKSVAFRPTRECLEKFYAELYWYEYQTIHECPTIAVRWEQDMLDRVPQYLAWVRQLLAPPGKILEVGCGNGRLLHELALAGYECEGAEMDPKVAAWVADKAGIPVYRAPFPPVAAPKYHLILAIDVLEHIPDPISFVNGISSRLCAGGQAMVHCPVINSVEEAVKLKRLFNPLSHLWMHTSQSHSMLWARVGLAPAMLGELSEMPCFSVKAVGAQ